MSQQTVFMCDRCGANLKGSHCDQVARLALRRGSTIEIHVDLCDPCTDAVVGFVKTPPPAPVPVVEEPPPAAA